MSDVPTWLSYDILFVMTSIVIALGIAIQTIGLYRHDGKVDKLPTAIQLLSFLDGIWFFVAGLALYFLDFDGITKSVPVMFMLYMVLSFLYAGMTMEGVPDRPEDIVFAKRYLDFNITFVFVFGFWCIAVVAMAINDLNIADLFKNFI